MFNPLDKSSRMTVVESARTAASPIEDGVTASPEAVREGTTVERLAPSRPVDSENIEYPSGLRLALVMISLMTSMFLVALVRHSLVF
jgi:hypothetical protein